jgi:hypothetical protein
VASLPVSSLVFGHSSTPRAVERRQAGKLDLVGRLPEVEFVSAVMIVEPNDGFIGYRVAVVERVHDAALEHRRLWDLQHSHPGDRPVRVLLVFVPDHHDIVVYPVC